MSDNLQISASTCKIDLCTSRTAAVTMSESGPITDDHKRTDTGRGPDSKIHKVGKDTEAKNDQKNGVSNRNSSGINNNSTNSDAALWQALEAFTTQQSIPSNHVKVGLSNLWATHSKFRTLLIHKRLPDHGWSDHEITWLLYTLSTLDTNQKDPAIQTTSHGNYTVGSSSNGEDEDDIDSVHSCLSPPRWCGVGEREGRVYSSLVASRHYGFSHGIGRSGDVTEAQPKAAGSSILCQLTLCLAMDAIRRGSGLLKDPKLANSSKAIILPLCTGMSMTLVLRSIQEVVKNATTATTTAAAAAAAAADNVKTDSLQEQRPRRDVVLWSRIDQKSCFKAIATAGLTCVVIPTLRTGDVVGTNLVALKDAMELYNARVLAVITTTSCFCPRIPDAVDEVAKLCQHYDVYHVINHAYGLQCATTCQLINRACTIGRVDAIVMSTDKNFLVPVGGAIVLSPSNATLIEKIGNMYAGRATASHVIDLFLTLLSMGLTGYTNLLKQRQALCRVFQSKLSALAQQHGERILQCQHANTISYGMTLDSLVRPRRALQSGTSSATNENKLDDTPGAKATASSITLPVVADTAVQDIEDEVEYLQSIRNDLTHLGSMLFSRCVSGNVTNKIGTSTVLTGFGSSCDDYPRAYLTAACAIGMNASEMNEFFHRLDKTLREHKRKLQKQQR